MKSLENKVAFVTGASSGIGRATAIALAKNDCKVCVSGRRKGRLSELVTEIEQDGAEARMILGDISDEDQVDRMIDQAHNEWGNLDILVNSAGIMLLNPVLGVNTGEWRQMISVNMLGLMYLSRAVLPIMKSQGEGHIVNISSTVARFASPNAAVYSATKAGIGAFSDALRKEMYKDNIRVTVIEPGATETEISDHLTNERISAEVNAWTRSIRQLDPSDVAAAVLYAVTQPPHVSVYEILVPPVEQVL